VINLSMKGKIAPERLENDNKMNSKEYFYHFLIIVARATFVIGALVMTTQVEFLEGIYFLARIFLIFVLMTITIPVVFFLAFLPVNLSRYRRYYSSDYRKTPSLEIRDFHSRLFYEWNSARENYQTPLAELITGKETPDVEYKASYWTELDDAKKKNLLLQDSVIKVVAGLMNSKKGGHVIIGIQDNTKEPTGLVDEDISQLSKDPSWDQLERHIVNTLENNLSSASSILPNEAYVLKEERWPQNEEGERIILIYIPQQANTPVYALQKATQKIKLRKWREKHAKMSESERYPKAFVPEHLKGDFKFRFLRKQTSTKHQNQEDWDKHWHDL